MKSDINGCSMVAAGQEHYEIFFHRKKQYVQYDYRTPKGTLFSTVAPTLKAARSQRDKWVENMVEDMVK